MNTAVDIALDHSARTYQNRIIEREIERVPVSKEFNPETYHDDFHKYEKDFQRAHEAFYANGGFLDGKRLSQFSQLEDGKDFEKRQQRAYFVPLTRLLANAFVNSIYGISITRDYSGLPIDPTKLTGPRGSWNETMRHWLVSSITFGSSLAGLDRKKPGKILSLADEVDNPLIPYVVTPLRVMDWSLNGTEFDWIKLKEKPRSNRGLDWRNPKNREDDIKVWDADSWHRFENVNGEWWEVIGQHSIGMVPIIPMTVGCNDDPGSFYGPTDFLQVAKIDERIYNLFSEIDDQLINSSFSTMAIAAVQGSKPDYSQVGTKKAIAYYPEFGGVPPSWFAPSSEPVEICYKSYEILRNLAFEMARLGAANTSRKPATAVQKIFENEEAEKAIRSYSQYAENAERRLVKLALKMSGYDPEKYAEQLMDPEVLSWPKKFDMNVLRENYAAIALQLLSINWTSEEANKYYEKHFSTTLIPMDQKTRKKIMDQVEKSTEHVKVGNSTADSDQIRKPMTEHNNLAPETISQADVSTGVNRKDIKDASARTNS